MWEYYLASSELAFRYGGLMVFQAQLARRLDSVPLTRDYMYELERERSGIATVRQLTPVKREA
jgi:cyclopropane-fatty-acyl-phospholipid synthase